MLRRNTWVWHWDWTAIVLLYTLRTPSVPRLSLYEPICDPSDININSHQLNGMRRLIGKVKFICSTWWKTPIEGGKGGDCSWTWHTETQRQKQRLSRSCSWGLRLSALALVPQLSTRSCCCHFPLSLSLPLPPVSSATFIQLFARSLRNTLKTMIWKEELNHVYKQLLAGNTRSEQNKLLYKFEQTS